MEATTTREQDSEQSTLYVKDLPEETQEDDLFDAFAPFGQVVRVTIRYSDRGQAYAFVQFGHRAEAEAALAKCAQRAVHVRHSIVKANWRTPSTVRILGQAPARCATPVLQGQEQQEPQEDQKQEEQEEITSLWVGNLQPGASHTDIRNAFSCFGEILAVKICQPKPGAMDRCGFVKFASRGEAAEALRLYEEKKVQVLGFPVLAKWPDAPRRQVARSSGPQALGPSGPWRHLPPKTRLCGWSLQKHGCMNQGCCHNAHNEEELRVGWQAHLGSEYDEEKLETCLERSEEAIAFFMTTECPSFARWGSCANAEWCKYAHDPEERKVQPPQRTRLNMPEEADLGRELENDVFQAVFSHMGPMRIFHLRLTLQWWLYRPTRGLDLRHFLEERPRLFLVQGHFVRLASPPGQWAAGHQPQAPPLEAPQQVPEALPQAHREVHTLDRRLGEEQEVAMKGAMMEEIHEEEEHEEAPQEELRQGDHEVQLQQREEHGLQQELQEHEEGVEAPSDVSSESSDEEEVLWPLAGEAGQSDILEEVGPDASEDTPIKWETLIDAAAVSAEQRNSAHRCLAEIQDVLAAQHPGCSVQPFGSMETGFGTAGCDFDLSIKRAALGTQTQGQVQVLASLETHLLGAESRTFAQLKLVASARVPVLKIRYAGHLEVDITVNNNHGVSNTRLLRKYSDMHPSLRRLVLFVKLWAKAEGLCGAPDGHLSSYAWTLLALYFLRVAHGLPRPSEAGVSGVELPPLPSLLVGFFRFYASAFRWGREVASERCGRVEEEPGQVFSQLEHYRDRRLHIEDPLLPRRNLADVLRQEGGEQKEARLRKRIQRTAEALEAGRHQEIMEMCFRAPQAPWGLARSAALEMVRGEAASAAPGLCSPPSSSPASSANSPRQEPSAPQPAARTLAALAPTAIAGACIPPQPEKPELPQHAQQHASEEALEADIHPEVTNAHGRTAQAASPEREEEEDAADLEDDMQKAEGLLQVEAAVSEEAEEEDFELPTEQLELWAQDVVRQKGPLRMPLLEELLAWWRWAPDTEVAQFVKDRRDMFEVDGEMVSLSPPKAHFFQ